MCGIELFDPIVIDLCSSFGQRSRERATARARRVVRLAGHERRSLSAPARRHPAAWVPIHGDYFV